MKRLRLAYASIPAAIVAVVALALIFTLVRGQLMARIDEPSDMAIWSTTQTEIDLLRLMLDAQRFAVGDGVVELDELRGRADILFSRANVLEAGDLRKRLSALPQYQPTLTALRSYLTAVDQELAPDIGTPMVGQRIVEMGLELRVEVHDFAQAAAHEIRLASDTARQREVALIDGLAFGFLVLCVSVGGCVVAIVRLNRVRAAQRLADITDTIPGAVFQLEVGADASMRDLFVNRRFEEIRGFAPAVGAKGQASQDEHLQLVLPEDRERLTGSLVAMREGSLAADLDLRIEHPREGLRWLNLRAAGRREGGSVLVSGVYLDVTEKINQAEALFEANRKLAELSATDGLTGIANRRKFDEIWQREWTRAVREGTALGIALIDVDHFKLYNDRYGHQSGDDCLRDVAQALVGALRRGDDFVARYGGEEFVVILPGHDDRQAQTTLEQLRAAVEALGRPHEGTSLPGKVVTISGGLALDFPKVGMKHDALIERADQNLYHAKRSGRNQVCFAPARAE